MAKQVLRIKLNGAPEMSVMGEAGNLHDLRKLLRKADTSLAAALKVLPALGEHKIESITIRAEHARSAAHHEAASTPA